jgi:hypothetical protein
MNGRLLQKIFLGGVVAVVVFFGSTAMAASTGIIDPNNTGQYQAAFLDSNAVSDTAINFGKFTTESQYNITVSDSELQGYAWGASVGYIVTNCVDTTSGCSATNANFKIANDGTGLLSGYAWGENTGWINFGPFTDSGISTVKIDSTTGNFEGTQGAAGYAWSQNYGWIVFDCTNASTCVNTNWRPTVTAGGSTGGGGTGGGGATGSGPTPPPGGGTPVSPGGGTTGGNPTTPTPPTSPIAPTAPSGPGNGGTPPSTGPTSGGGFPSGPTQPPSSSTQPTGNPASTNVPGLFSGGIVFPPQLQETLATIVYNTGSIPTLAGQKIASATTLGKIATIGGLIATLLAGFATLLFASPFALAEIFLLPFRLWTLFLIFFGYKKRHRPWGTVYDSVTKQPIDPAYVVLMDMNGIEVETSITDIDGRYGFSVQPGTYRIVANKSNYVFPSKKLEGRTADELYADLYFGGALTIKEEDEIIAKNIPLDQLNFDWNDFAKSEQKRLSYFKQSDRIIAYVADFFFWLGAIFATVSLLVNHTLYNVVIFLIYVVIFIIRRTSPLFKAKGSVVDARTGQPLSFAIVRVFSLGTGQEVIHKVADRLGNYYCLLPNGSYTVTIDRKDADGSYTKIPVTEPVEVKKGYLKEEFKV